MAVRGLTRFARPAGSLFATLSSSNWLSPVVDPGRGFLSPVGLLIPGGWCNMQKPAFSCELFFKYGGEGIDSLCSPYGQPVRYALSLSSWLRQLSNPGRGFSSPQACNMQKPAFSCELFLKYGGEGIRTPIRCRIHTFRACSFSHSDTSPYCFAAHPGWATGATIGSCAKTVKQYLFFLYRSVKQ